MPADDSTSPPDIDSRRPSPQALQKTSRESNDPASSTHLDSAAREKVLASQLRRRAMASRTRRSSQGEHDREPSRTPPSSPSESSPPPQPHSSSSHRRKRSLSRSRSRSPSPTYSERKLARRQDGQRDRDRRRRRSGRDIDADDADDSYRSSSRSRRSPDDRGERSREIFIRGTSGRATSNQPDGEHVEPDDDDDARSIKSVRSHRSYARSGSMRADSREPDEYASRRRRDGRDRDRDRDRNRRRRSARQDSRDYDGYRRGPPPPTRDRRLDYDPYSPAYQQPYGPDRGYSDRRRRPSPLPVPPRTPTPERDDYELRSIFCSQLAARLTQRDLGEFFEEKLGEDTVKDVRIVTDRITGRSKGIGYVELVSEAMVERAIHLSGEKIYGIPILVQKTEAARNRGEGASTAQAPIRPNAAGMPVEQAPNGLPLPPHLTGAAGNAMHLQMMSNLSGGGRVKVNDPAARLYVGSLHFSLTDADVRSVFEPFGDIEDVDLHREPTGKSKGFAFVQFKTAAIAEQAIAHMNGFELAGRNIRVGHTKGSDGVNRNGSGFTSAGGNQSSFNNNNSNNNNNPSSGDTATLTSAFDEGGGGGLNAHSRANLMQMLARGDSNGSASSSAIAEPVRPSTIPQATSRAVLLKNMFNPEEETDADWDTDLSEDVKGECSSKYGNVELCHVEKDSSVGEIYLRFTDLDGAAKAIVGLNGRFFGGRKVSAEYVSESFLTAKLG